MVDIILNIAMFVVAIMTLFATIIGVLQSQRGKPPKKSNSRHNKSNRQVLRKFEVAFIIKVTKK